MKEDNVYWAYIWSLVAGVIFSIGALVAINEMYTTNIDAELIKSGIDPIKLRCMRSSHEHFDPICVGVSK